MRLGGRRKALGAAMLAALGCGPQVAGSSGGAGQSSSEASAEQSDSGESTAAPSACGSDGIFPGPVLIRSNDDAAILTGCRHIDGDVLIDPCRICLDLGCVECGDDAALTSLAGLESLESVSGSLIVGWDDDPLDDDDRTGHVRLASLAELEGMREIGGDLHLGYAPALSDAGFPRLERVGGELTVADSFHVEVDFPVLGEVGSHLALLGNVRREFEFPRLEHAGGITLYETRIGRVDGAPLLRELPQGLNVVFNDRVADLSPLLEIELLGSVAVYDVAGLVDLALPHLPEDAAVIVHGCSGLQRVSIPTSVERLAEVRLSNAALIKIEFESLEEIEHDFEISGQTSLSTVSGFSGLKRVRGTLVITDNPQLCASEVDTFVAGLELDQGVFEVSDNGDC